MKSLNKIKTSTPKGRVLKFTQSAEYYCDLALDYLNNEEYINALDFLRRAIKLDSREIDYRFLLAQTYTEMGLYSQSNFEYFKLLAFDSSIAECYLRISQNYFFLKETSHAVTYLKKGINFDFDDDEILDVDEIMRDLDGGAFKLISKNTEDEVLLNCVKKLMSYSEYNNALQLLKFIKPDSKYYISALNNASFCCARIKQPKKEIEYAKKVLAIDFFNIYALCNLCDGYSQTEEKELADTTAKRIIDTGIYDNNDYFKAAVALLECGYTETAIKYLNNYLTYFPYNESALMLLSLAYYNIGDLDNAKIFMFKIISIDDSNTVAKYYNKLFQNAIHSENQLLYIKQVPQKETAGRIQNLKKIVDCSDNETLSDQILSDKEFFNKIKWGFDLGNNKLSEEIINRLSLLNEEEPQKFLRECLVDHKISGVLKQMILRQLLKSRPIHKIALLHEEEMKYLNPKFNKLLDEYPETYFDAYVNVYTALAFVDEEFEAPLNRTIKKLLSLCSANKTSFRSKNAISALIANTYGKIDVFKDLHTVCGIFRANLNTVKEYKTKLGIKI